METTPQSFISSINEERWTELIDARDVVGVSDDEWLCAPSAAEVSDTVMDELERVTAAARLQTAAQYRVIGDVLRDAAVDPDPWVGADPTLDPLWVDSRRQGVAAARRERQEFAVRAAAADIAVRLRMSEQTVRAHAGRVDTLRARCPLLWDAFVNGRVSEQNAMTTAQLAASLPDADESVWALFDAEAVDVAGRMTPAKFRTRARTLRERVHPESLEDRHRRAAEDRTIWVTPELDGMAVLSALLPAATAQSAFGEADARARHLHTQADETRTLAQLRADVFADLLTAGAATHASGGRRGPRGGRGDGPRAVPPR